MYKKNNLYRYTSGFWYTENMTGSSDNIFQTISMSPVLHWNCLGWSNVKGCSSIIDHRKIYYLPSGRAAIAAALEVLGIKEGDEVLFPAYHCPSMVEPVIWMHGVENYFCINSDMSPDLTDIEQKISSNTRAIVAVHYFGFQQDMSRLRELCDTHSLYLIEDCAHCYFTPGTKNSIGSFGDLVIASPRKIFSSIDGGLLISGRQQITAIKNHYPGISYNLKMALNIIETAVKHDRMRALHALLSFKNFLKKNFLSNKNVAHKKKLDPIIHSKHIEDSYQDPRFGKTSKTGKMSRVSQIVLALSSKSKAFSLRRDIFYRYAEAFENLNHGKPLYNELEDCIVPYVFPLLIDDPDIQHYALKQAGVPIFRWDILNTEICPVSNRYQYSLLQLPCHQGMRSFEVTRIIDVIKNLVG